MADVLYREALNQALREEMRRDERVFLLGEDIGLYGGAYLVTAGLLEEFGEKRVRDTPIAEEAIIGAGIGAAMVGLRPVVEIMTINFILIAIDQVVNHAAKISYMSGGQFHVPLVIRTPGGGGLQLAATHSQNFQAWFAHIPGLTVVAPATPADAKGLLKTCIRQDDPVVFVENLSLYNTKGLVPDGEYLLPIGKASVLREGSDLTIIGHSRATLLALDAAKQLEQVGVDAEVVDLRSLRPLDLETVLASVRKTNRVVVVDEGLTTYGVSAEIAAAISDLGFDYLDAPVKRIGYADVPMPYARDLELAAMPDAAKIAQAARDLLGR